MNEETWLRGGDPQMTTLLSMPLEAEGKKKELEQ